MSMKCSCHVLTTWMREGGDSDLSLLDIYVPLLCLHTKLLPINNVHFIALVKHYWDEYHYFWSTHLTI